ncbi:unnamed protein product [Closterium sp. Naga37s-1]|nr:unnamed protein product [Closterium sp. Naga37s-1]
MIFSAISSAAERTRAEVWQKLVSFENSVANAVELGAGAGAMILRTVMGSFAGNFGPTAGLEQPAGRIPTLGAGPAADTSLPLILSGGGDSVRQEKRTVPQGAEGAVTIPAKRAKAAGKESPTAVAAVKDSGVAVARLAIAEGKNEGAVEISDDEDAEAMESRKRFLAARAAAKGAGCGGAKAKDPMEQLCIGTGAEEGGHKNTVWHDRVQRAELVLTDQEEAKWADDLELARKMNAGLYSTLFLWKLAGNYMRMVNIFKKCREIVEVDSDHTVRSALRAAAGLEVADDDGKVKGKAQKTLFAAAVAFGFGDMWSLTAEYTRSNTAGGARSAWKGVTTEVRAAAVKSGSAAAKLCGATADVLEGLQVCWRDVYAVIRKRQGDKLEAAANIEKTVLKLFGDELDMTDKFVVHQLIQGKNGDAGEKDEKKGEEAEHSDGKDEDDDTLMMEGSEAGEEFA